MGAILGLFGNQLVVKLGLFILEWVAQRQQMKKEDREYLIKIAKAFRAQGLSNVRSRFESESQIDLGNSQWDEREKEGKK